MTPLDAITPIWPTPIDHRTDIYSLGATMCEMLEWLGAYRLAEEATQRFGSQPELEGLLDRICREMSIETTLPGAKVFVRPYEGGREDWTFVGRTPLESVRRPRGFYHFRIETEGATPIEFCARWKEKETIDLTPRLAAPRGMAYNSPYSRFALELAFVDHGRPLDVPGFYIDRDETKGQS